MYVMQSKNTFIREFGKLGYIASQLSRKDRVYDQSGAVFLGTLSRKPRNLEDLVTDLNGIFNDAPRNRLKADMLEFITDLEKEGFLITGDREADLVSKDVSFSYGADSPKTIALRVLEQNLDRSLRPSDDVMTEYFRDHPTIFGVHFEVTSRCNEQCIHCYQSHCSGNDADVAMVTDVLAQLHEMGAVSLTLSGGEPFLHRDFPHILRLARHYDFMINILSNGTRLSPAILEALEEVNVSMLQVSLYSMDPAIHDGITGMAGSHRETVRAIERLIHHDIPVQVSCPVMKQNRDAYPAVSQWCSKHKIRVLSDFVLMARSDFDVSNLEHRLDIEETRRVISDIIEVDGEYQIMLDLPSGGKDREYLAEMPVCGVAVDNVCFTAEGNVYPCSGFQGYVLGNVKERSVREIWEQSEGVLFLRSILNRSFPRCLSCEAREYCIMCLVRNYNESGGDMFKVADHFCDVAFLNKELVEAFKTGSLNRKRCAG